MSATYSNTADDALIGAVLGNYRITSALSVGGMGSVYRAQHELLDRPAAIKLLRPELTANDELVQRFFNEARAATAIRHPGIVEVYDFGYTDDGHAFLVMELIDGQLVSTALREHGPMSELQVAQIARNIASALKAAHAKGIVHRDLKPDNIFLVPDPDGRESRVKVLDFGIAKLATPAPNQRRQTLTGVLLGTPKYMAPEQAREAGTIDHRADLYSLGCIMYELLVGEPPFVADGAGEIIAMQLFTEPTPPSQRTPVSAELEQLVMRLLAKEPADRPQSAQEVIESLVTIGARMSGPHNLVIESGVSLKVTAATQAVIDANPTLRDDRQLTRDHFGAAPITPLPPARRSPLPFVLAGLALAIAGGTVAFFLSRGPREPAKATTAPEVTAPVAPVVTAPPPVETKPVVETKAEIEVAAPIEAKKKPVVKTGAKIKVETKVETKLETKLETKPETKPDKLKTVNDSPIETDIGDGPRKPKAP